MDESQGSPRRILAAKFFDKVAEIDQIANTALANSTALQSELSNVQMDLRSLIESLQVDFDSGVQNIQNQINEVTNVIIQEQEIRKSETETLQEQIFAQEDQLQKDVKGKKAKTISADSFSGKMRQKLRDKAKENSGVLGLLGASAGLTAISSFNFGDGNKDGDGVWWKPWTWNKGDGDDKEETEITEGINTYENNEEITEGINTYENNEEITEGINTYENNEEKTFLPSFSDLKETFQTITGYTLYKQLFPNDKGLLNMFNNKKENNKQIIETNESISGDLTTFTVDGKTYPRGHSLGYNPLPAEGGSTYGDPNYDPYSAFKLTNTTDNNSNNEVIDGGTTVIEGDTQVVDGGTTGKKRGEVATSTNLVKPANSSVVVINFAENNSQKELSVGI